MLEPVKPLTTAPKPPRPPAPPSPRPPRPPPAPPLVLSGAASRNLRHALAVSIIFLAARFLTPSASPSPQTSFGRIALWRSSIRSQTAWPTRWLLIAKHVSLLSARTSQRPFA